MGVIRRTVTASLIVGAGVLIASPAQAAPAGSVKDLTPQFECSAPNSDGTYTAFFSYTSDAADDTTAAIGAQNQFTTPPKDRGQPTTFSPGHHVAVFGTQFNAGESPSWHLGTTKATADTTKLCSAPPELSESSTWMALPAASLGSIAVWGLIQRRRRNRGHSTGPTTGIAAA
jgi:hypothetical protein